MARLRIGDKYRQRDSVYTIESISNNSGDIRVNVSIDTLGNIVKRSIRHSFFVHNINVGALVKI